jgi:hypothetical protein
MSTKSALSILLYLFTTLTTAKHFNITSFYNSGSPHSITVSLSFMLSDACLTPPLTNVYCYYSQSVQPSVATTSVNVACNDTSVNFGFQYLGPASDGYYLNVVHIYDDNKTVDAGMLYMGNNVTTVIDEANPNGNYQHLVHETAFLVGYNRVENCC